jgi:zeaxanthin glucosyltransferase
VLSNADLGTIKEALCFGVPLVVLPRELDQPGNAARVVFHGYGRRAGWDTPASELAAVIRETLRDEQLRSRTRDVRKRFREALGAGQAAKAFERCWEASLQFTKRRMSMRI